LGVRHLLFMIKDPPKRETEQKVLKKEAPIQGGVANTILWMAMKFPSKSRAGTG
jgi:hypothetical protein